VEIMPFQLIGAPLKLGADNDGLDRSIKAFINYNKCYYSQIQTIKVDVNQDVYTDNLKHLIPISKYCNKLAKITNQLTKKGIFPVTIGGDHTVALGTVAGISKDRKIAVYWLDAHGDFNTGKTTTTGHIHGMPLAALAGFGDSKLVDCFYPGPKVLLNDIVMFGSRDFDQKEKELIKKNNIAYYPAKHLTHQNIERALNESYTRLSDDIDGIHISLDLDVLDPLVCPGVSVPVANGFTLRELEVTLRALFRTRKVTSVDIVEYNPRFDKNNATAKILDDTIKLVKQLNQKYNED